LQHIKKTFVINTKPVKPEYSIQHTKLIEKIKKGDRKAQFEMYKLYYKAMYNTALRIVNDNSEAEDIMQESFLSAFSKIETYKAEVSFGAWLKKIVVNKSLDFLKKSKLMLEEIDETKDFEYIDDFEIEQDVLQQVEKIKKAISKLADGYRVVLSLYLLEGYDHSEIAEILNIQASASRSQFTRAKKKLLEILSENNNNEPI